MPKRLPSPGGHSSATAWRRTIWTLIELAKGPVHRDELIGHVAQRCAEMGDEAYADPSTAPHTLRHDLQRLRSSGIPVLFRRTDRVYALERMPFSLHLAEQELWATALIRDVFGGTPHNRPVQALLHRLTSALTISQQAALVDIRPRVRVDLAPTESLEEHDIVVMGLQRAMHWHQQVEFTHQSPTANRPKWHRVEPIELVYEDQHFYVHVWDAYFQSHTRYRVDRIVPASLKILSDVLPTTERHGQGRVLRFRFTPDCALYGVTVRFPEQQSEVQPDGSIIVTARMTDQFTTVQTLLRYGDGVECLEPEDVRNELWRIGRVLVRQYANEAGSPIEREQTNRSDKSVSQAVRPHAGTGVHM